MGLRYSRLRIFVIVKKGYRIVIKNTCHMVIIRNGHSVHFEQANIGTKF